MAKKEFIGLTYEDNRIRFARIRVRKKSIKLLEVDTIYLPQQVAKIGDTDFGSFDLDNEIDDLFDLDDAGSGSGEADELDDFLNSPASEDEPESTASASLEDSFDMTKPQDEGDLATENEKVLADYFAKSGSKKLLLGTHIPFGKTIFQFFKNTDPGSMKKSDRIEFFEEKLGPLHQKEVEPDDYSWIKVGERDCLVAYTPDERQFINLIEITETYFPGTLLINERLPDEAIWAGLTAVNYNIAKDDITGLIAIGESTSRIIFMKGNEIVNILPIITEGESSENILNTIFSKILFEIDKGDLPKITRLLITRSSKLSERAKKYFTKQFDDVEVDFLNLNPEIVTYSDEILNSPLYQQPYLSAIGAAWAASKINEKEFSPLSTLPEYIREKQRVLKLAWHGIIILALIALTPLYLNNLFLEKADELRILEQDIQSVEMQINDLRPIATMTEDLIGDLQLIQSENDRLLQLAAYSQKWSEMVRILNSGVSQLPNVWLTSLRTNDQHVSLTGISLTREQIPRLAGLFSDANVQQVSETEIRGEPVFSFSMQANNVRQDIDEFLIDMPEPDYDSELPEVYEFSDAINLPEQDATEQQSAERNTAPRLLIEPDTNTENRPYLNTERQPETSSSSSVSEENQANEIGQTNAPTENQASSENENEFVPAANNGTHSSPYGLMGAEAEVLTGAYTIVLHSIPFRNRAEQEKNVLEAEGFKATLWQAEINDEQMNWRIGVGQFETLSDALSAAEELPEPYRTDNFIIRIR